MARKTVKVKIPLQQPDDFSKLLKDVYTKHTALGANSPLNAFTKVNMTNYNTQRTGADAKRGQAIDLHRQAENLNEQADMIFGRGEGQTMETPNTLYNMISLIRDYLLVLNAGNEEALSEWGFKVVVDTAKSPVRKPKA
ncbi:MAG: hypothetical protein C0408_07535 [Odoribacter sp.]|nr:hypothetical protein [Odoribacter sp.]